MQMGEAWTGPVGATPERQERLKRAILLRNRMKNKDGRAGAIGHALSRATASRLVGPAAEAKRIEKRIAYSSLFASPRAKMLAT
jgi:hypothetical protein